MGPQPPVYRDAAHVSAHSAAHTSLSCDVSFVSDDSTPPHVLVARQIERMADAPAAGLFWNIFDRMRADYDAGGFLPHSAHVGNRIRQAMATTSIELSAEQFERVAKFFDRVNETMFLQQTLAWLAGAEFKLHLYGRGWENHPTLASHARGLVADDAMRLAIYRATRINLQARAYGVVDARLLEGVASGGFFLLRYCPADMIERFFPPIREFCAARGITSNAQLSELATPGVRALLAFAGRTIGIDILRDWPDFVPHLETSAEGGYTRSAASLWAHYPAIAFSTRDELLGLIAKYLYDVPERHRLAEEMRRQLNARFAHIRVKRHLHDASKPAEAAA